MGGYVIAIYIAHISSTAYWTNIMVKLSLGNIIIGLGKPFVFAIIISTIATYKGFQTTGGTRPNRASMAAVTPRLFPHWKAAPAEKSDNPHKTAYHRPSFFAVSPRKVSSQ